MMTTASLTSAFFSTLFIFSKTPLMMAMIIIAQAVMVSFITFMFLPTSWFSFILFMVFVSAMMIIFVYVSSLASNDFFTSTGPSVALSLVASLALTVLFFLSPALPALTPYSESTLTDLGLASVTAYKLYAPYILLVTLFLIIYLLVALIVVAKNSSTKKGALRASTR
nr:TPA_asm: ND6 [Gammarus chevreuxi]